MPPIDCKGKRKQRAELYPRHGQHGEASTSGTTGGRGSTRARERGTDQDEQQGDLHGLSDSGPDLTEPPSDTEEQLRSVVRRHIVGDASTSSDKADNTGQVRVKKEEEDPFS